MTGLAAGDSVCLPLAGDRYHGRVVRGIVEFADNDHVKVRWSDGTFGLLYFDGRSIADARLLQPIREFKV